MTNKIKGKITSIFPDDINTDDIIPAWTLQESTEKKFFKKYAFANLDPEFVKRCARQKANIIVGGKNFGCGSSREQAVYALTENNVIAVIAKSFPDIFYRNSLNNGLVLVIVEDTSLFKINDEVVIDLIHKNIVINDKKIDIKISDRDAKIFSLGGRKAKVKNHLREMLKRKEKAYQPSNYIKNKVKAPKPQTMVEKIISEHLNRPLFAGEEIERLPADILFLNEVIAPFAIREFFENFGQAKVFDSKRIFFIPDHTIPSSSINVSEGITLMEEFAKKQGIYCYKEGDGIEHVVLIEDGYIVPGEIILGTDSHTDTHGALNTLAFGIGTTDASFALATGRLFDFKVPETIRINLLGKFKRGVSPKDLILYLIGKLGVDGALGKVVEFGGSGLKQILMAGRTTIANMAVEMGARTAIFDYDQILENYLQKRAKFPYKPYFPDKNCHYEKTLRVNLSTLEPCVAFPHKPENVTFISKIKDYMKKSQSSNLIDFPYINSLKITDAFLGACTNGRYEDFTEAAKIIKGRKVHREVNFVVIPASRKVYNQLLKEGVLRLFAEAGANIESSNCGPCFGKHMGVLDKKAQMISSSNRNYLGRMGAREAKIFLASPATVTASAIAGKITDPRKFL